MEKATYAQLVIDALKKTERGGRADDIDLRKYSIWVIAEVFNTSVHGVTDQFLDKVIPDEQLSSIRDAVPSAISKVFRMWLE